MDLTHAHQTREGMRLRENQARTGHWNRWGPFLSERAWGTVREDYSAFGTAWDYFPHDHARSRTYRWNEDGLAGICDRHQHICFAIALWNGRDPILKERLFGLTNSEGNHGEDVKEYYFYLDNTPTHSYMKSLYKYPQAAFPYANLVEENRRRTRTQPEYELLDTGVFAGNRYFDVFVEYAKGSPEDILIAITVVNRGPEPAYLELLPTIWFRNTWSWDSTQPKPSLRQGDQSGGRCVVELHDPDYGQRSLYCQPPAQLLFTENDTNFHRLFGVPNATPYVKDAFHEVVVHGRQEVVNPAQHGTKAAARYQLHVGPGQSAQVRLRLSDRTWAGREDPFGAEFDQTLALRLQEADEFYATIIPDELSGDAKNVMRQALAGMLWSKQFYRYELKRWLDGDPSQPPPPSERLQGRNREWMHLYNADVISMPDKWEFPWYASWDLAFHCVTLALVDPEFAKAQLALILREWYMHPNGQIPAYEWAFDDVNPPVHAWAALRVYQIERRRCGVGDRVFLERVFHKLLLNFTWWVNRKDALGTNIFQGGFLGLDNIGLFDRSQTLWPGVILGQSDGTSWMAMYCLNLLAIALELATHDPVYEDVASKFWEHFLYIANAIQQDGEGKIGLWDEDDGFFYDVVRLPDGDQQPIKIRSMVGLIPLLAVIAAPAPALEQFPGFKRRMEWFMVNRPELTGNITSTLDHGQDTRFLMSVVQPEQLRRILRIMLDEREFLSPYGIRSVSKRHRDAPYAVNEFGVEYRLAYEPGEASSTVFGGNSNWRGPIWMPVNYLLIEALQRFDYYLGDSYRVECPTGSGQMKTLSEVAVDLSQRLSSIFLRGCDGRRPLHGSQELFQSDPHWKDLLLFYEYFHGDNGRGCGASHQTGWTALVAKLLQQSGESLAFAAAPLSSSRTVPSPPGRSRT
jgi:Mannosylglycerate hydrolase MGH1-like glycoside hydrolase domain